MRCKSKKGVRTKTRKEKAAVKYHKLCLQHTATHCNTLQHTATHYCHTLQQAPVASVEYHKLCLQHTATHCNTLQHTVTHNCNTLQQAPVASVEYHKLCLQNTATHCKTLQHRKKDMEISQSCWYLRIDHFLVPKMSVHYFQKNVWAQSID